MKNILSIVAVLILLLGAVFFINSKKELIDRNDKWANATNSIVDIDVTDSFNNEQIDVDLDYMAEQVDIDFESSGIEAWSIPEDEDDPYSQVFLLGKELFCSQNPYAKELVDKYEITSDTIKCPTLPEPPFLMPESL